MNYNVLHSFYDDVVKITFLKGEKYPSGDYKPTEKQLEKLSTDKNKVGYAVIELIEEEKEDTDANEEKTAKDSKKETKKTKK